MSGVAVKREETVSSALVSLEAGEDTGAGTDCALAIVPVQVKMANGSKSVLTYAFLESGSSATFCTERLMRQLKAMRWKFCYTQWGRSFEIRDWQCGGRHISCITSTPRVRSQ